MEVHLKNTVAKEIAPAEDRYGWRRRVRDWVKDPANAGNLERLEKGMPYAKPAPAEALPEPAAPARPPRLEVMRRDEKISAVDVDNHTVPVPGLPLGILSLRGI